MNRTIIHLAIVVLVLAVAAGLAFALGVFGGDDGTAAPPVSSTDPTTTQPPTTGGTSNAPSTSGGNVAAYVPEFEPGLCEFTIPEDQAPRCGWLIVPENRAAVGNGKQVRLHVAIFPAASDEAHPDPIVYLDGGPGGETLEALFFSFAEVWAPLLRDRDLIFFDQRGVGLSQPTLACPEELDLSLDLLDEDLAPDEFIAREMEALALCRDRLLREGVDLAAYDSAANAADVADLRVALGYDELNLLGISYGTRLAQTIMRDHPEGVRSVVLDSTYPVDADIVAEAPDNLVRAFDVLFAACTADDGCSQEYPDLGERVFALAEKLEDEPIRFTARDFLTGEEYDALIDGTGLLGTIFQGLYSDQIFPSLPEMVTELENGETGIISLLVSNDLINAQFFSFGMHLSVQCREEVAFSSPESVAAGVAAHPRFTEFFAEAINLSTPVFALCELWQAGTAPPVENEPVTSEIPTLVLAGSFDPITPPRWGREVADRLTNASYVEFPTLGHGTSVAGDCPVTITLDFISDPAAAPVTECIVSMDPVPFVIAPFDPETIELIPFTEALFGVDITGVVPEGWDRVGPGAWSRGHDGLDQTTIVQQVVPGGFGDSFVLGLYEEQLGIDGGLQPERTVDRGGSEWTIYVGTFDGFAVDVALADMGDVVGLVLLIAEPLERVGLIEAVFDPALSAYSVG